MNQTQKMFLKELFTRGDQGIPLWRIERDYWRTREAREANIRYFAAKGYLAYDLSRQVCYAKQDALEAVRGVLD